MKEPEFYKSILDKLPAVVYVNQIDDPTDFSTARNIFSNTEALKVLNCTQEEIDQMGSEFFKQIIHPDDFQLAPESIKLMSMKENELYGALHRIKKPNGEYLWSYGYCKVLSYKDEKPWQFVNVAIDITDTIQTEKQLEVLLKEISCLKNKLALISLTKREKEIAKLIAKGDTDKEIGDKLFISQKTAQTHRNKIIHKLNLRNTADLVRFTVENNLC